MAALCCKPCELLCQGCGELCKCIDKGCACCCKACQVSAPPRVLLGLRPRESYGELAHRFTVLACPRGLKSPAPACLR
eukprot:667349-Rhodomonas_salina.1